MRDVDRWGMEVIHHDECLRLLQDEEVGRLGVIDHGAPLVLPVNFVLDGDAVVFRTAAGTKLDSATRGPVAFEADHIDPATRSGWSVVVRGTAEEVTTWDRPDLRDRLAMLPLRPWPAGEKPHLVRISSGSITGRRILENQ